MSWITRSVSPLPRLAEIDADVLRGGRSRDAAQITATPAATVARRTQRPIADGVKVCLADGRASSPSPVRGCRRGLFGAAGFCSVVGGRFEFGWRDAPAAREFPGRPMFQGWRPGAGWFWRSRLFGSGGLPQAPPPDDVPSRRGFVQWRIRGAARQGWSAERPISVPVSTPARGSNRCRSRGARSGRGLRIGRGRGRGRFGLRGPSREFECKPRERVRATRRARGGHRRHRADSFSTGQDAGSSWPDGRCGRGRPMDGVGTAGSGCRGHWLALAKRTARGSNSGAAGERTGTASRDVAAARTILGSTTTSVGPPIIRRCSTLSRRIRISRRLPSTDAASTTASRGWRPREAAAPNRSPPKRRTSKGGCADQCKHDHEGDEEPQRQRHLRAEQSLEHRSSPAPQGGAETANSRSG